MMCSERKASRGASGRQRQSKSNAASPWQAAVCPPPMCLGVQRHTEGLICCCECQCFLQAWSEQDMTLQQAHLRSCCPPPRRRPCHHQSCLSLCARQMWPAECCTPPGHVGPAGKAVDCSLASDQVGQLNAVPDPGAGALQAQQWSIVLSLDNTGQPSAVPVPGAGAVQAGCRVLTHWPRTNALQCVVSFQGGLSLMPVVNTGPGALCLSRVAIQGALQVRHVQQPLSSLLQA